MFYIRSSLFYYRGYYSLMLVSKVKCTEAVYLQEEGNSLHGVLPPEGFIFVLTPFILFVMDFPEVFFWFFHGIS